jgi:4-hydroxy-3-polyprenylbenzoate decarboxylase
LSLVSLRALVALKEAGATVMPACPGFYARPATIGDLVDQVAARILDRLGLELPGARRYVEAGEE